MTSRTAIIFQKIKSFFDETDIRALVFIPPVLGLGGFLTLFFVIEYLSEKPIPESYGYIGLGIACLVASIAGVAEIYKKEMPGSLGKIIKGNMAIISGVIIVVLFGFGGLYLLIHGINVMFSK